jgi:hypothetical protein
MTRYERMQGCWGLGCRVISIHLGGLTWQWTTSVGLRSCRDFGTSRLLVRKLRFLQIATNCRQRNDSGPTDRRFCARLCDHSREAAQCKCTAVGQLHFEVILTQPNRISTFISSTVDCIEITTRVMELHMAKMAPTFIQLRFVTLKKAK